MAAAVAEPTKHAAVKEPPEATPAKAPTGSRRLLLLLHGEKANDDMVRNAISRLRSEGHHVMVRVTYEAGDVDRLVKEAIKLQSADTLIAAGGDGTVCEVVAAVLEHTGGLKDTRQVENAAEPIAKAEGYPPALKQLSVGILPMGTSNDFAATTGIPQDPYEALLLATRQDSIKPLDVGLLNGKVFMNTATIGASADVGKVTSSGIKKLLGPAAFLFTGVRSMASWMPVSSVLCFPNIKEHGSMKEQKHAPDAKGTDLARALSQDTPAKAAVVAKPGDRAPTDVTPSLADEPAGSTSAEGSPAKGRAATNSKAATTAATKSSPDTPVLAAASQTGSDVGELEGIPLLHITAANNRQIASMVSVAPNALLDDGMLDCVYITGAPGEQVKRLLSDVVRKGLSGTKVASNLLRVPWLEVASEQPLEWSLDGEPQDEPSTHFRFSLLHRSVQFHLPDDRMLVAGQPEPEAQDPNLANNRKHEKRHRSNPLRLPRGRLHAPSLGDMLGRVVRFRKKKNWGAIARGALSFTVRTLLIAGLGGALVHWWHTREEGSLLPRRPSFGLNKLRASKAVVKDKKDKSDSSKPKKRHMALTGM